MREVESSQTANSVLLPMAVGIVFVAILVAGALLG